MEGDMVADDLVRSVLPRGWRIGDRTGYSGHGSRGIGAVLLPPDAKPITLSIYITDNDKSLSQLNKAIANISESVIQEIGLK